MSVFGNIRLCLVLLTFFVKKKYSLSQGRISSRRNIVENFGSVGLTFATIVTRSQETPAVSEISGLLTQVEEARKQLNVVPKLIENEKWDSIRAILIEPPLADCWAKTSRPLLSKFAEALGDVGGDELAALEAREELVSHLRYLDMAVYNNNFNPITVEGKTSASKSLIQSYYEDPSNELKASISAFDELISLSKKI
mmetsp:Transcript_17871/g.26442  ORF Transcript_17871/g.26442 Transcript_17871/m.26442 type:complete len:197 (+) Transcript_17871:117-707(+)